jgi:hypothetical protein
MAYSAQPQSHQPFLERNATPRQTCDISPSSYELAVHNVHVVLHQLGLLDAAQGTRVRYPSHHQAKRNSSFALDLG